MWFRFYEDVINDPKVQSLSPEIFKFWVNILCVMSKKSSESDVENAKLPKISELSFLLRMPEKRVKSLLIKLVEAELLDESPDGFTPHNWDKRQYKSDTSRDRMRKLRDSKREEIVTTSDGECDVTQTVTSDKSVTRSEQSRYRSDTEKENKEKKVEAAPLCDPPVAESPSEQKVFPNCPHEELIAMYHARLPSHPRMQKWTDTRRKHLQARWKEHPHLSWWEQFFDFVGQSKFLTGQVRSRDRPPFFATLDWLVKSENFAKVLEDKYHHED